MDLITPYIQDKGLICLEQILNFKKKAMKRINLIYASLAVLVFQSCESDLEIKVKDPLIVTAEQLYSTPAGYKQGLAGVYGNLALTSTKSAGDSFLEGIDAGTSNFGRCLWYLQTLTTDEAVWSYENDEGVRELQRNTWGSNNAILLGMFSRTMAGVAIANDYIRQSSPSKLASRGITNPTDIADIDTYRNEARAIRAYYYYVMMDLFGKAPFVTENDPIGFKGSEYDRQKLFGYVESELNAVLPNLKAARSNEYGRVDKAFAWAVLAKIYLNAEQYIKTSKYSDCLTVCSNIINSSYSLKSKYLDNFKGDNDTSSELLFTIQADGDKTQSFGASTIILNGQVGSIEGNGIPLYGIGGYGGALRLRKQFVEKFDGINFNNDSRKTIISGSRPIDITNIGSNGQGYVLGKFSNKTAAGGSAGLSTSFAYMDFPLFRLADFYLMYAEAQMRVSGAVNGSVTTNANATSIGYINALRTRANNGSTATNVSQSNVTLDFIIDERARELHWEAHRRQDLIRFNKYTGGAYNWAWKGNIANGTSISDNLKIFPIPSDSKSANSNLTQNPGY
jgi:starch-binding outer membrane protein, SusD/RagB family